MVLMHDAVFGDDIQRLYHLIEDDAFLTKAGARADRAPCPATAYRDAIVQRNAPLAHL